MKNYRSQEMPLPPQNLNKTIKFEISKLGSKAKVCMDENQILSQMIKQQSHFLTRSKKNLKKYITRNHPSIDIQKDLATGNLDISKINKSLKVRRFSLRQRYHSLSLNMDKNLNYLKDELVLLSDRKFIYENALIAKEINIQILEKALSNIVLNAGEREEIREIYSGDIDDDEDEMIKNLEHFQRNLLSESKNYNKYHNKCEKLTKEILELKNILNGKTEISNLSKSNISKNSNMFHESKLLSGDLNLNIINESSSYYDDDSFYEDSFIDYDSMNFHDMVSDKCCLKNKKYGKILNVPNLDLKQIEFNKKKIKQEDAEKSLSREFEDSDSEINKKIKKMKEKIKKIKKKNLKKIKLKELEKKITQMKKIINNYTKYPIKEQSKSMRINTPTNHDNKMDNRISVTEADQIK